jgi:hypothetical protein
MHVNFTDTTITLAIISANVQLGTEVFLALPM